MATNVSYRTMRSDFHVHPKTAGLSPFARDLFTQALLANIAGVLQRSVRQMAKLGAMTTEQVQMGIEELCVRGVCRYFEDEETLWLIEAADEQASNGNAWKAVFSVVDTSPSVVRKAFEERYPRVVKRTAGKGIEDPIAYPMRDRLSPAEKPSSPPAKATAITQDQDQDQDQKQEQKQDARAPDADGTSPGHWLREFAIAWAAKRKVLTYGHTGDAKACASLGQVLDGMHPSEVAAAWLNRVAMFAEYLADPDPRVAKAGHIFAFFVPRFRELGSHTPKPKQPQSSPAPLPMVKPLTPEEQREMFRRAAEEAAATGSNGARQ